MKKKETKQQVPENNNQEEKMELDEINSLLVELYNSKFWPAIQYVNNSWKATVDTALKTTDPFKEPTLMARGQGELLALGFLESHISGVIRKINKAEEGQSVKK